VRTIFIQPCSPVRKLLPIVQKLRYWAWKFHDRTAKRLVISGGKVKFLDAELRFPEKVGVNYSTELFWTGPDAYEAPTSRTIALLAGQAKVFLDVGSNIGIYSVYVGVKFPDVKTFAFEPVPGIWEKNCAFHRANGLPENTVHNNALSDSEGERTIYMPVFTDAVEEEQTATLNAVSWQAHEKQVEAIQIRCLTLDAFVTANPLPNGPCCLKVDVENHEAAVLRGGEKFIAARRPWIVCEILPCEEFDPATKTKRNNNRATLALVQELGYVPFAITGDGLFRMTPADFARPRGLKDFLLVPAEQVPADLSYFALENIGNLFHP
jgi:FkbM family methyltransferase